MTCITTPTATPTPGSSRPPGRGNSMQDGGEGGEERMERKGGEEGEGGEGGVTEYGSSGQTKLDAC